MSSVEEIAKAFPLGSALPPGKLETWMKRLLRMPRDFTSQRRYVNRFRIGADPEFVFMARGREVDGGHIARKDARGMYLKQGPAFGADNNGRLAEIRPYPSRSAIEVVASVLATLRWMAIHNPIAMKYEWHSGGYIQDDGIGGHVHFGRKRPNRVAEIAALDNVEETLLDLGVFSAEEARLRRGGDARHQIYGMPGDFRLQAHGYEYRTFPSWLDSPELAFLTLTLSKLAVHEPNMVWRHGKSTAEVNLQRVRNLLSFYKFKDDDARLALVMLKRAIPAHRGGDFRARWGITGDLLKAPSIPKVGYIPSAIRPDKTDISEMFDYLAGRLNRLPNRIPKPSWTPTGPPDGNYYMVIDQTETLQQKGLGELVLDLCCHGSRALFFQSAARGGIPQGKLIQIPKNLSRELPSEEAALFATHTLDDRTVYISQEGREGQSSSARKLLMSGALPVWRVRDCQKESFAHWKKHTVARSRVRRWEGKFLRNDPEVRLPGT